MSYVDNMSGASIPVSYFAPGPAKIPREVLCNVRDAVDCYRDTKVSILEISHRSKDFFHIIETAEGLIRELLRVPDDYSVLFLQGGGTGLFAAVPMNLMTEKKKKAVYIVTGSFSQKAAKEAAKYGEIIQLSPPASKFPALPDSSTWNVPSDVDFVFYCDNETIQGLEFYDIPEVPPNIPLVCDMSSNIFSRPVDISKFGVVFGGTQKNAGCAGATVVIVRRDLIGSAAAFCPSILDFAQMEKNKSILNTPPTLSIYVLLEMLEWMKKNGGVEGMAEMTLRKSQSVYSIVDQSAGFYCSPVEPRSRSRMNAVFRIGGPEGDKDLEAKFCEEAAKLNLLSLKGHRSVGGIRVSLYNGVSLADVARLEDFMMKFMQENRK